MIGSRNAFRGMPPWLALACLAACGKPTPSAQTSTRVQLDGGGRVQLGNVAVEFDASVTYRYHSVSGSGVSGSSSTVEGHPFSVRDGIFFIGPNEYGAAPEGARIQVTAAGVTVNGEARGPLPGERKE